MDIRIRIETQTPQIQLYQHREDMEVFGYIRSCASGGCPAVFTLMEPNLKTEITKDWQFYLVGANYAMDLVDVSLIMHYELAFCNQTGLGKPDHPRRDYILGKNLNAMESGQPALPKFDKDRTCARSVLTGIEVGDYLKLTTFDGNQPPPMKPGKRHPQTIGEINIDDYLYNPREHRWMFLVANTIRTKPGNQTSIAQFPRGGLYEWTNDNTPYTFVPHISRQQIYYPLKNLIKLPLGSKIPSPYRVVT